MGWRGWWLALVVGTPATVLAQGADGAATNKRCNGVYANTLQALSARVVRYENEPGHSFVYCLRTVATYEQAYYARDGKLRKRLLRATAHGTGFAFRSVGQDTLLLTNQHVQSWPDVTEEEGQVRGVPAGARKVSEQLLIVRNDEDDYEPGFVPLSPVVGDVALDAAVVRARKPLHVMPYSVGSSAALQTNDALEVRGYPLGAFAAANVGKVTNPYVEDQDNHWNHADFAMDALVNRGNSGSPVLAVNCSTGEYELVGLFHAGYRNGQAMNLAVGIDELKPLMETLQAHPKTRPDNGAPPKDARLALAKSVGTGETPLTQLRFGDRLVQVSVETGNRWVFRVYGPAYPADPYVWTEVREPVEQDDKPPAVRVSSALVETYDVPADAMDAESREHMERVTAALLSRLWRVQQFRAAVGLPPRSKEQHKRAEKLLKELNRQDNESRELVDGMDGHLERSRLTMMNPPMPPDVVADLPAAAAVSPPRVEVIVP